MIHGKFLAVHGVTGAATLAVALVSNWSTWAVAIIGIGGALTTAGVGMYSAFRAAKHKADLDDTVLVQPRLSEAEAEIRDLRQEVTEWRTRYQVAIQQAQAPTSPPSTPTAGVTRDPPRPGPKA